MKWRSPKMLRPLRRRDFALLWGGMTISLLGDGIYIVAIAWLVLRISNSPTALGVVGVAWTIPQVISLLWGGVASDRFDRRIVMIAADIARCIPIGIIGLLSVTKSIELWHVFALVAFYGAAEGFFMPAFSAMIPDVVPEKELVGANALDQFVRPLTLRFAGPAIGGIIIAAVGVGTAFLIDAATFVFSAVAVYFIKARPSGEERRGGDRPRGRRSARVSATSPSRLALGHAGRDRHRTARVLRTLPGARALPDQEPDGWKRGGSRAGARPWGDRGHHRFTGHGGAGASQKEHHIYLCVLGDRRLRTGRLCPLGPPLAGHGGHVRSRVLPNRRLDRVGLAASDQGAVEAPGARLQSRLARLLESDSYFLCPHRTAGRIDWSQDDVRLAPRCSEGWPWPPLFSFRGSTKSKRTSRRKRPRSP